MHHSASTKENAHKINKADKKAQIVVNNSRTLPLYSASHLATDRVEVIMMYALRTLSLLQSLIVNK